MKSKKEIEEELKEVRSLAKHYVIILGIGCIALLIIYSGISSKLFNCEKDLEKQLWFSSKEIEELSLEIERLKETPCEEKFCNRLCIKREKEFEKEFPKLKEMLFTDETFNEVCIEDCMENIR